VPRGQRSPRYNFPAVLAGSFFRSTTPLYARFNNLPNLVREFSHSDGSPHTQSSTVCDVQSWSMRHTPPRSHSRSLNGLQCRRMNSFRIHTRLNFSCLRKEPLGFVLTLHADAAYRRAHFKLCIAKHQAPVNILRGIDASRSNECPVASPGPGLVDPVDHHGSSLPSPSP